MTDKVEVKNPVANGNDTLATLTTRIEENEQRLFRLVEKINELIEENMANSSEIRVRKLCLFCNRGSYNRQKVCSECIEEHRPKFSSGWMMFYSCFLVGPGLACKARIEMEQKE
jgi:hypothetical protein